MAQNNIVACPGCGKRYSVPPGAAPGQFPCQDCGAVVIYGAGGVQQPHGGGGHVSARTHAKAEAARRKAHRGRRDEPADEDDGGRRGHGHGLPPGSHRQSALPYLLGFVVVGLLVGIGFYAASTTKTPPKAGPETAAKGGTGAGAVTSLHVERAGPETPASAGGAVPAPPPPLPPEPEPKKAEEPSSPFGLRPAKSQDTARVGSYKEVANPPTGGNYGKSQAEILQKFRGDRTSVVTDLPQLPDTPSDVAARIDADVALVADPNGGSERFRAVDRLIKVGRAAIPRTLGLHARLEFTRHAKVLDAMNDCIVADAIDNVLRGITGYQTPPTIRFSPEVNLALYPQNQQEWYVWWLTVGYRRETFYRQEAGPEDDKL